MSQIKPVGAAPATLVHVGEQMLEDVQIRLTVYSKAGSTVESYSSVQDLPVFDSENNYWLEIGGLHNTQVIDKVCQLVGVDKLVAEDILNTHSSSKVEDCGNSIFWVIKVPFMSGEEAFIHQLSLVLKSNVLISFTEDEGHFFEPIYRRMSNQRGRLLSSGVDYLACALMDLVIDQTLHVMANFEEILDALETSVISENAMPELAKVHGIRREVAYLQRAIRPQRDVVHFFLHTKSKLVKSKTTPYFNDLNDHAVQASEFIDFLREYASSLRELYYTTNSHRMNETMRIMAGISVIFMPLSFLAGIYGMNFENMPELGYSWSYPALLGAFTIIASTLFILFKRRGWF